MFWWEKLQQNVNLEDPNVDGELILEYLVEIGRKGAKTLMHLWVPDVAGRFLTS
jgi:hypothetical protein